MGAPLRLLRLVAPSWACGASGKAVLLPPEPLREVLLAWGQAEHPNASFRSQASVPEDFSAPLELPQPLSSLVDDYGILPKHPWRRGPRPLLSQARQRKRDGPDMAEYYSDTIQ
ncbi:protein Frey 1 [Ctenodactylus gundi]